MNAIRTDNEVGRRANSLVVVGNNAFAGFCVTGKSAAKMNVGIPQSAQDKLKQLASGDREDA